MTTQPLTWCGKKKKKKIQNFKVQLGPLATELEKRNLGTFTYSQGTFEVEPPVGWEDYFGSRPLYRFLDTSKGDAFETLRRLRHVPRGMNPEETMRQFQQANEQTGLSPCCSSSEGGSDAEKNSTQRDGGNDGKNGANGLKAPTGLKVEHWQVRAWRGALDGVFKTIEEDEEIDAIIGYSEGAMVGASLVLEEGLRCKKSGAPRRIKVCFVPFSVFNYPRVYQFSPVISRPLPASIRPESVITSAPGRAWNRFRLVHFRLEHGFNPALVQF